MSETSAHEALAQFLHHIAAPRLPALLLVWHTPNEANAGGATITTARGRVPLEAIKNARMGVRPGVWDWLYIGPNLRPIDRAMPGTYQGLAIELKSTRAYCEKERGLSSEQIAWGRHYSANSWYTEVFPEERWTDAARLLVTWVGGRVQDFDFGGR